MVKIILKLNIFYFSKKIRLNRSKLGSKFSAFQEIYKLDPNVIDDMNQNNVFYNINILTIKENLNWL